MNTVTNDASVTLEGISKRPYTKYADLSGKTVFITGGSSGIGAHLTFAFASQGANVAFVSLDAELGARFCDAVAVTLGRKPFFQACDITDVDALKNSIANVADKYGVINVLINNAARDDRHDVGNLQVEDWDTSLNTNLRPHYFTAQAVVAGMRAAGAGSIINLGSNSANLGLAGYPAYVTAKAGIVGLTRALARELGPHNIRVNTLIPGWVMTARQTALWVTPAGLAHCLAEQCLKSTLNGEDIAETALFLASTASRMITGQSIVVDGGRALV
jgi:NAD(P)-dependent dehydrogenase (short-subunit alcohol dehydrogenase family)